MMENNGFLCVLVGGPLDQYYFMAKLNIVTGDTVEYSFSEFRGHKWVAKEISNPLYLYYETAKQPEGIVLTKLEPTGPDILPKAI